MGQELGFLHQTGFHENVGGRLDVMKEKIRDLEDTVIEAMQNETQGIKRFKKQNGVFSYITTLRALE